MFTSGETVIACMVFLPLLAALGCFLATSSRLQNLITISVTCFQIFLAYRLAVLVSATGTQIVLLGDHQLPLAIALRADGLSTLMVVFTAVVSAATAVYACGWAVKQSPPIGQGFRTLLLLMLSGVSALFLADDLFNVYVTLEITTLAAVALVILAPGRGATEAAMRYLLLAIIGSLLYLLGVALVYAAAGQLSMHQMAGQLPSTVLLQVSLLLMTAGLGIKAAMFPVHAWLPAAHASAPSVGSALLSALVAKGAAYLILRIWTGPFAGVWAAEAAQLFAALGIAGMLYASLQALRQSSIKRVIAYSTVAQIGYLPLLIALPRSEAWLGAAYHALAHGLAKAALFLAAGNLIAVHGDDHIGRLSGSGRRMATNTLAIGIACISLIGLPPSGGFVAKWWLIQAALETRQWWWAIALGIGSLLAAAYLLRLLGYAMVELNPTEPLIESSEAPLSQAMLWSPLLLALAALLVGLFGEPLGRLISVGAPEAYAP